MKKACSAMLGRIVAEIPESNVKVTINYIFSVNLVHCEHRIFKKKLGSISSSP
jgi:hypothetical protein